MIRWSSPILPVICRKRRAEIPAYSWNSTRGSGYFHPLCPICCEDINHREDSRPKQPRTLLLRRRSSSESAISSLELESLRCYFRAWLQFSTCLTGARAAGAENVVAEPPAARGKTTSNRPFSSVFCGHRERGSPFRVCGDLLLVADSTYLFPQANTNFFVPCFGPSLRPPLDSPLV